MLDLPKYEPGIKENSSYFLMPPDKKTAANLFYIFASGHYYLDATYACSLNTFGDLKYPNGMSMLSDGRFYSEKYDFTFNGAYHAIYVASGSMMYLGKEVYTAGTGQVLLIDKYRGHSFCSLGDTEKFYIHFDGNCSKLLVDELLKHGNVFPTESMRSVEKLFRKVYTAAEKGIEVDPIVQSANVHSLLSLLHQSLKHKKRPKSRITDCVEYINAHYKTDISIEKLCKIACLSHSQFALQFKKELNISPYEYLLQVRLTIAQNCLVTTNMSVAEIAYEVGFNSDVRFMNLFKKRLGMTPSAFRKAHRDSELIS